MSGAKSGRSAICRYMHQNCEKLYLIVTVFFILAQFICLLTFLIPNKCEEVATKPTLNGTGERHQNVTCGFLNQDGIKLWNGTSVKESCDIKYSTSVIVICVFLVGSFLLLAAVLYFFMKKCRAERRITSSINKLSENPRLAEVKPEDIKDKAIYEYLSAAIEKSWRYKDQAGRDALNLSHSSICITRIYAIRNDALWHNYVTAFKTNHFSDKMSALSDESQFLRGGDAGLNLTNFCVTEQQSAKVLQTASERCEQRTVTETSPCDETHPNYGETLESCDETLCSCDATHVYVRPQCNSPGFDLPTEQPQYQGLDDCNATNDRLHPHCSSPGYDTPSQQTQSQDRDVLNLHTGEMYLFHGTKAENIDGIIGQGFSLIKAEACSMYGPGIYLTDSSQKADQYGDSVCDRRYKNLTMVVVRTVLGSVVQRDCGNDTGTARDTYIAGQDKRFLEYIKNDPHQCYPAFVVVYDRCDQSM